MQYNSNIDNVRSKEWGLNLSEAYVFSFLYSVPSWAKELIMGGEVYYFASRNKAIEQVPLATDKPDTMYRYYKSLVKKGLILHKKIDGKDCIKITEKGKQWNQKIESASVHSEINPTKFGNKSENDSEINPTNKTISIDKNTTDESDTHPMVLENRREAQEYAEQLKRRVKVQTVEQFIDYFDTNIDLSEIGRWREMRGKQRNDFINQFAEYWVLGREKIWDNKNDLKSHLISSLRRYTPQVKQQQQENQNSFYRNMKVV